MRKAIDFQSAWKHLSVLAFMTLLMSCGASSGTNTPIPGFGDLNIHVFASDGTTPLEGYTVAMSVPADQQAYVQLVAKDSSLTTDKNGNAHMRIEFVNPDKIGAATITVTASKPNCTSNCEVGSITGSLPETLTLDVNLVTSVDPGAA